MTESRQIKERITQTLMRDGGMSEAEITNRTTLRLAERFLMAVRLRDHQETGDRTPSAKRGFTLIEILVALTIITILTSTGFISINNALDRGRDSRRKQDLATIKQTAHLYFEENGYYPPNPATNANTAFTSDTGNDWIPNLTPTYIKQLPADPKQALAPSGAGQAGLNNFLGGPQDAYAQSIQLTVTTFCQNDTVWFSLSWQSSTGFGGSTVYDIYQNGAFIWSTRSTSYQKDSGLGSISEGSFRFQIHQSFPDSWSNQASAPATNCVTPEPPPTPCPPLASASAPAGSQTVRFAAPSFGYLARSGPSYPPEGQTTTVDGDIIPMRTFNGETYFLRVGMVGWDTGTIPDNATIHSAILQITPGGARNDDKRNLTAEWYNNGWPIDTSDWTATASATAFCIAIADLTAPKDLPLTNPAVNINKNGVTALRLHISGGKPKGFNHVVLGAYNPILIVNYTVPAETTPTPTPSGPCSQGPTPGSGSTYNLTICADFDGWVEVNPSVVAPNSICHDNSSIEAGMTNMGPHAGWPSRGYLRFPLGQLPATAAVNSVQLIIRVDRVSSGSRLDFAPYGPSGGVLNPLLDSCNTRADRTKMGNVYNSRDFVPADTGLKTISLTSAGTDIANVKKSGAGLFSLAINEDNMFVSPGFPSELVTFTAGGADIPQLLITYTLPSAPSPTPSPAPTPVPSPSPLPGGGTCTGKQNVYCYIVTPDHLVFILWAKLENANDPEISSKPQAACTAAPPDDNYNYCLGPD